VLLLTTRHRVGSSFPGVIIIGIDTSKYLSSIPTDSIVISLVELDNRLVGFRKKITYGKRAATSNISRIRDIGSFSLTGTFSVESFTIV